MDSVKQDHKQPARPRSSRSQPTRPNEDNKNFSERVDDFVISGASHISWPSLSIPIDPTFNLPSETQYYAQTIPPVVVDTPSYSIKSTVDVVGVDEDAYVQSTPMRLTTSALADGSTDAGHGEAKEWRRRSSNEEVGVSGDKTKSKSVVFGEQRVNLEESKDMMIQWQAVSNNSKKLASGDSTPRNNNTKIAVKRPVSGNAANAARNRQSVRQTTDVDTIAEEFSGATIPSAGVTMLGAGFKMPLKQGNNHTSAQGLQDRLVTGITKDVTFPAHTHRPLSSSSTSSSSFFANSRNPSVDPLGERDEIGVGDSGWFSSRRIVGAGGGGGGPNASGTAAQFKQ